ncbi:MAG: Gfo/Idh/MocA family oxidoreductase [Thermoproteota archaeon]
MVRFAMLSFAHIHAWSYAAVLKKLPNVSLEAIYDDSKERLSRAGDTYNVRKLYDDYTALLEKEDIDAVIISSENSKHYELMIACIEAGKHVLVEKPITTRLEDADDAISRARRKGVKLQTAFVMRYHDTTVKAREILESKALGEILAITSTNHGKYPGLWFGDPELAGGGCIMDHNVHVADLIRWYTGDECSSVYARVARNIRPELRVEDAALIMVRTRRGVNASIDCSWSRPDTYPTWGDVYMGVFCEKGYMVIDAFRSNVTVVRSGSPLYYSYYGADADRRMIESFIEVIEKDEEPVATGMDGRQALEVTLAAYQSAKTGRIIEIPLSK